MPYMPHALQRLGRDTTLLEQGSSISVSQTMQAGSKITII